MNLPIWICLVFTTAFATVTATNIDNYESKLREDLFVKSKHDAHTRPVTDHTDAVDVQVGLSIQHIIELNEKSSMLSMNAWVRFVWTDKNFVWNPDSYGNLSVVRVDPGLVWKPDIIPYNSAKAGDIHIYGETNVLIYSSGQIFWVPPVTLHTICDVDVHNYPFDEQLCEIKFGSWTHDGFLLNISNYKGPKPPEEDIIDDLVTEHNEWKIVEVKQQRKDTYYSCCPEPYPLMTIKIRLQRRAPYYQFTLVIPSILTMLLTLTVFWLPSDAGEKIILSSFVTLMQLILLVHIYYTVPKNGSGVPAIVTFNGCSMIFIAMSTILSVISLKLSRASYHTPVPVYLKNLLSNTIGKLLCLGSHYTPVGHDTGLLEISETKESKEHSTGSNTKEFTDWLLVTTALNRVFFLVYILLYIITMCASFL